MIARKQFAPALLVPLFLIGCASLHAPTATGPVTSQPAARHFHENLDATGRLSLRYQGPAGPEILAGNFEWRQQGELTRTDLFSPLGQLMARIETAPHGASLQQAGQPPSFAPDVDALTAETLGWPLPVSGLRAWLQGFALDAHGRPFVAAPGHPRIATADGWQLHYAAWETGLDGQPRPRRIDLNRPTAQAGEVAIRIIIDTWQPR